MRGRRRGERGVTALPNSTQVREDYNHNYIQQRQLYAKIESSPVWDTSCLSELIYDFVNRQFICRKCPKPVKIQFSPTV